jgi:hypothetical protein
VSSSSSSSSNSSSSSSNSSSSSSLNIHFCQRMYQVDNWGGCTIWIHSGIVALDINCAEGGPVTKGAQIVFGVIASNPFSNEWHSCFG